MLLYHIISFLIGFMLDLIIGDPYSWPHPIRLMGKLIQTLEDIMLKDHLTDKKKQTRGKLLVLFVLALTGLASAVILYAAYSIHFAVGIVAESIMTFWILAAKCLRQESRKVYLKLQKNDIEGARSAVSMIVGRDTAELDEAGIIRAAVETVAENCSDGVIAPMLFLAFGGPAAGFLYKAVNTMDSMIGYKNERYMHFGRAAAKLDDIVNYVPARMSAVLMLFVCFLSGKEYNAKEAFRIFCRDRYAHASPNSAQTESVCAGALGIQLAGDAVYGGLIHKKPFIGDAGRDIFREDINRAGKLLYRTAFLCEGICLLFLFCCWRMQL